MILVLLILIPILGGIVGWALSSKSTISCRWAVLLALVADLGISLHVWFVNRSLLDLSTTNEWLLSVDFDWIPQLGISFCLGMDGLSLLMVILTLSLGIVAVLSSWSEISERPGFFHFNLMVVLAGLIGVFTSLDLILFFFFWEAMLVPMYFIIGIWGHENRFYAAIKFFIFTQAGSLAMLIAILGLYFVHGEATGAYTFKYADLLGTPISSGLSMWLMLGFFVGFGVKIPIIPLHTWLPDAHTEAPTAGSVILAGLLLKTGAYGLLRFVLPLFPEAAARFAPIAMILAVIGILYGAFLALAQSDMKRLIAYTSVSHLGFVLLGIFAWNKCAMQGAVLQMVCHGLSTGGLFVLAGALHERIRTYDMNQMGGLWTTVPKMGAIGLILALASLGLPGMGNFMAEFLVLLGAFQFHPVFASIAVMGLVLAAVYSLMLIQKTFYGSREKFWTVPDFGLRELLIMGAIILALLGLGLNPQPVVDTVNSSIMDLERKASDAPTERKITAGTTTQVIQSGRINEQH